MNTQQCYIIHMLPFFVVSVADPMRNVS